MDFLAIWRLSWVSVCLGRFEWSRLDLRRLGLICIGSAGLCVFLSIWADFTRFQLFGGLEWIRIDVGIFEFVLLNLIGVV